MRNVTHSCVNLSMSDAQWLYDITHVGDPVAITGTEQQVLPGNGYTAWSMAWEQWIQDQPAHRTAA